MQPNIIFEPDFKVHTELKLAFEELIKTFLMSKQGPKLFSRLICIDLGGHY